MANSDNPLDQIEVGQSQPAVLANELFDAMSPAALFGRRNRTTTGLTWGYYGGRYLGLDIAHGTVLLPASQGTVYIVANKGTGVVSQSTSSTNWDDTDNYIQLYIATTGSASITAWDDYREWIGAGSGGVNAEQVQDIIAALLVEGTGVTLTYDDAGSPPTLTVDSTGGGGADVEEIQDIVGALLVAGTGIDITYDDASSPATITIEATGGGGGYSEGSGLPPSSPAYPNGWRHFETDDGILYTWSDYASAWVQMGT